MSGLLIAAPSSGSGKTTVTLGLMRALKKRGVTIAPGKAGPDYIDPAFHAAATGEPCFNYDPWAMRPELLLANASHAAAGDRTLIVEAEHAGVLEPGEKEMIAGVMRLGDRPVGAVMTPRRDVDMIDISDPAAVRDAFFKSPHSRLPAHDGDRDHPIGVLQAKDLLDAYLSEESPDLKLLVRDAPVIPESADARDVLAIL